MDTDLINSQLNYYGKPGKLTECITYKNEIGELPNQISELTKIVQGLAIHWYTAMPFYGFEPSEERIEKEAHIRHFDKMIEKIFELDHKPLYMPRTPDKKIIGVCHHFAKLLVSILREKGIPARMRYGFGSYFNEGYYEDHSVCEYWNSDEKRWIIVDPQFDSVWQEQLNIKHNVLDVPRDKFLTPADSWILCRQGLLDPDKFGIFEGDMRGLWFIAGNLIKDIASLNKMELLQWDSWSGMPRPNNTMKNKKTLSFFDDLASLAMDPEKNFEEIKNTYENSEPSIKVGERVFNAFHRHLEWIFEEPVKEKKKKTK